MTASVPDLSTSLSVLVSSEARAQLKLLTGGRASEMVVILNFPVGVVDVSINFWGVVSVVELLTRLLKNLGKVHPLQTAERQCTKCPIMVRDL